VQRRRWAGFSVTLRAEVDFPGTTLLTVSELNVVLKK
jgi:hypothetical protein